MASSPPLILIGARCLLQLFYDPAHHAHVCTSKSAHYSGSDGGGDKGINRCVGEIGVTAEVGMIELVPSRIDDHQCANPYQSAQALTRSRQSRGRVVQPLPECVTSVYE